MGNGVEGHAEHYEEFAPNVIRRLEALEKFAERVDVFLFKGEGEHPSLQAVAYKLNRHVTVICDWAGLVKRFTIGLVRFIKLAAITLGSLSLIWVSLTHFGDPMIVKLLEKLL